jgi:hypothetical protein
MNLNGSMRDLRDIFLSIPSRRLVVVGPAGQGKSVLCLHLARELLDIRHSGDAVPVLLTLSTWNPATTSLNDWLIERLPLDISPALGVHDEAGRLVARSMVEKGFIIPILDGLDELPRELHARAIQRINDAGSGPLFLSCREEAFITAVDTAHQVVNAAAVVRLEPLALDEVSKWLDRTTSERFSRRKFEPLIQAAADGSHAALGQVLGSALMVTLTRAVYGDTAADPRALLAQADMSSSEIEKHLLGRLIPTMFRDLPTHQSVGWRGGLTARRAEEYLARLSVLLSTKGEDRIEWWRLHQTLPKVRTWLLVGVCVGGISLLSYWGGKLLQGQEFSWDSAVLNCLIFVLALILFANARPTSMQLSARPSFRVFVSTLRRPVVRGALIGGVLFAPAIELAMAESLQDQMKNPLVWLGIVLVVGVLLGAGLGLVVGAPLALCEAFAEPTGIQRVVAPRANVRSDRNWALVRGAVFGCVLGTARDPGVVAILDGVIKFLATAGPYVLDIPPVKAPAATIPRVTPDAASYALPAMVGFVLACTAWGKFSFARIYLAITGQAPWRLLSFLDEARDRGILRQSGTAYMFRHERLQEYLSSTAQNGTTPAHTVALEPNR